MRVRYLSVGVNGNSRTYCGSSTGVVAWQLARTMIASAAVPALMRGRIMHPPSSPDGKAFYALCD